MCGIAGFVGSGNQADLNLMLKRIAHRGPDSEGKFTRGNVFFGHRRLSIIDLSSAGNQPMWNEEGNIALIFNGEIYNFQELRKELLATRRHTFQSNTDTEVIIHLYEDLGVQCFKKLSGMFALAIYDFRSNRLILARDRIGKKPLYWSRQGDTIIFASELKSILAHQLIPKAIDPMMLNQYLQYDYVPTPYTMVQGVRKLLAGNYLLWDGKKHSLHSFWEQSFLPKHSEESIEATLSQLNKHLTKSVSERLVADVPVGVFLSGGLDSAVMAYYASILQPSSVRTFSVGFREKTFDESSYARMVAEYLNTDHTERYVTVQDMLDATLSITDFLDDPIADTSIIPTYLLSKFARESVTVVQSGDGGDELFAGYPTFFAEFFARFYEKVPRAIHHHVVRRITQLFLSPHDKYFSLEFKVKKFLEGFEDMRHRRHAIWLGSHSRDSRSNLLSESLWSEVGGENEFALVDAFFERFRNEDSLSQLLAFYQRFYLMDQVLVKVDRASMAHGLEVRSPFLSYELVDYVNRMPSDLKYRMFTSKWILKRLMHGKLPPQIINRKKQGFATPLSLWFKNELKGFISEVLLSSGVKQDGFFNTVYIERLIHEHVSGKENHTKRIWSLLVFELWKNRWLKR